MTTDLGSENDTNAGGSDGDGGSRGGPRFDPARERALERARARHRRIERESDERDRAAARLRPRPSSPENAERAHRPSLEPNASGSGNGRLGVASPSDATWRGVVLTLFTALLCALGYFGVVGFQTDGVLAFGRMIPAPFYALAYSLLFVLSLVPRAHGGLEMLARATAFSVSYGTLLAVAVEGVVHLADDPSIATTDYTGVTVFALALVVASLAYWGVLSVVKTRTT